MEFLLSLSYIRFEIMFLFWNLVLFLFFIAIEIIQGVRTFFFFLFPRSSKDFSTPPESSLSSEIQETQTKNTPVLLNQESLLQDSLSFEEKQTLAELVKFVRTKLARAEFHEARSKIVEGLAIDKWNKELNYLLASIYERDKDYKKAELIYKDLVLVHETDPEIYMKLWFALSIQGKYEIAYEIYKRILSIVDTHTEALEMLANLAFELKKYDEVVMYARQFLKNHPHSTDILSLLAFSLITLSRREEALEIIAKLKNLDPYNPRIREMKEKIELELELSKQFESPHH